MPPDIGADSAAFSASAIMAGRRSTRSGLAAVLLEEGALAGLEDAAARDRARPAGARRVAGDQLSRKQFVLLDTGRRL